MAGLLAGFRARYPQYDAVADRDLADFLHAKYYPQEPRAEFDRALGLTPTQLP